MRHRPQRCSCIAKKSRLCNALDLNEAHLSAIITHTCTTPPTGRLCECATDIVSTAGTCGLSTSCRYSLLWHKMKYGLLYPFGNICVCVCLPVCIAALCFSLYAHLSHCSRVVWQLATQCCCFDIKNCWWLQLLDFMFHLPQNASFMTLLNVRNSLSAQVF